MYSFKIRFFAPKFYLINFTLQLIIYINLLNVILSTKIDNELSTSKKLNESFTLPYILKVNKSDRESINLGKILTNGLETVRHNNEEIPLNINNQDLLQHKANALNTEYYGGQKSNWKRVATYLWPGTLPNGPYGTLTNTYNDWHNFHDDTTPHNTIYNPAPANCLTVNNLPFVTQLGIFVILLGAITLFNQFLAPSLIGIGAYSANTGLVDYEETLSPSIPYYYKDKFHTIK